MSEEVNRKAREMTLRVLSDIASRANLAKQSGQTFGDSRDLYDTLGYPDQPDFDDFLSFYLRGDISARIVDMPADSTWGGSPVVRSKGTNEEEDAFAQAIDYLDAKRRLFHYMKRADRIAGIGNYGVIILGLRTDKPLSEPLVENEFSSPEDLIYLATYHQGSTEITAFGEDPLDARFGLPLEYTIDLGGTTLGEVEHRNAEADASVHWTRVLHVPSDNLVEDDIHGMPRLQRVLNRLHDMQKLVGGSGEIVWQNVGGIWHADLDPNVDVRTEDQEAFEEDIQAAMYGLQRLLQTRGVDLDLLAGTVPEIGSIYDALKQLISAASGIPERKLFGSERGELASSQDEKTWDAFVESRRTEHAEPLILRALIDRLVWLGVLPPAEGDDYEVAWPPLSQPTQGEVAEIASKFADAIQKVAPAGAPDLIVAPWEFRTEMLRLPSVPPPMPDDYAAAIGESTETGDAEAEAGEE